MPVRQGKGRDRWQYSGRVGGRNPLSPAAAPPVPRPLFSTWEPAPDRPARSNAGVKGA